MANFLTIDPAYKDCLSVHDDCAKILGEQSQAELLQLAVIARKSNNPLLLRYFIDLPVMDELIGEKTKLELEQVKRNVATETKFATKEKPKA